MEMEKIGFLTRLVAYIIDSIIVTVVGFIILAIFGLSPFGMPQGGAEVTFTAMNTIGLLLVIVWSWGYLIVFWSVRGQTPGKMIMGIKIISTDGGSIGVGKSILRLIGYVISAVILYLGFLWIIWDKDKQGWHDKIAGTYVVKA